MSGFFHALLYLIVALFAAGNDSPSVVAGADADNAGFIHGRVTLESGGEYEGFIRWESEEAFWDDLFHSRQNELPWLEYVDMAELHKELKRRYFESHGMFDRVMWTLNNRQDDQNMARLFVCQFGFLEGIDLDAEDNVALRFRDGSTIQVHGYSNDVSSDLWIYSGGVDPVEVDWDDLASIQFFAAPPEAVPYAHRLYGTVESTEGSFEGFIQWDKSECTSIDLLDGRNREIPMGDIRSITRNREGNSDIVLKSGGTFTLTGSNDVGRGNRGVMVENPAWGRVTVAWKRFQSITFAEGKGSGAGRDRYSDIYPLTGTVTGTEGQSWTGRLVFDLDEAWTRDLFNGAVRNLDYDIPFGLIESIDKKKDEICRVNLTSGGVLELTDTQDTGAENAGILVFENGDQEARYIPWSGVQTITFEH